MTERMTDAELERTARQPPPSWALNKLIREAERARAAEERYRKALETIVAVPPNGRWPSCFGAAHAKECPTGIAEQALAEPQP